MAVETVTLYDALLKKRYAGRGAQNVATRNRRFLSMVPKRGGFTGSSFDIPYIYGNPTGRSMTDTTAYSTTSGGVQKTKAVVTRHADYASTNLTGELLLASQGNEGSFKRAFTTQVDGMLDELGHSISLALYRAGTGVRGRIASGGGSTSLVLSDAADAKNFRVGMTLVSSSADGGGSLDGEGTGVLISNINETTGTITVASAGGFTDDDYLFCLGDYDNAMEGLASWIPTSAGTLYSMDQSLHREMLAGTYISDTSYSIEESILVTAEKVHMRGGNPDVCFISHENFTNLVLGRESKVVSQSGGDEKIGFKGFAMDYSGGTLMVHPDPDCPNDAGYVLTLNTWELHHLGGLPHIVTDDGNRALRNSGDSMQVRARFFGALVCYKPNANGRFAIA